MVGFNNDVFSAGQVNATPSSGSTPIVTSNNGNAISEISMTNTTSGTDAGLGIVLNANGGDAASILLLSSGYTVNTNLTDKLALTSGAGTSGIAMNIANPGDFQVYQSDVLRVNIDDGGATFNVPLSVNGVDSGTSYIRLIDTNSGATVGPILDIYRNSPSPAASDVIGQIQFNGQDSDANKQIYGSITSQIDSPTNTSETSRLTFATTSGGSSTNQLVMLNTGCQLRGNNTNTAPPAGYIGEVLSGANTTGTALSSNSTTNISSVTLTPGIWDISGTINFIGTGANTVTYAGMSISTANNSDSPADNFGSGIGMLQNQISGAVVTATTNCNLLCGPGRLSVSTNTTYYLNCRIVGGTLNCSGYGVIRAVRIG